MSLIIVISVLLACVNAAILPIRSGGRIVGGVDATIEDLPYQVSIQVRIGSYYYHSCGGTIINEVTVISAGHCFHSDAEDLYYIRAGSNYTDNEGQLLATKSVTVHPLYNEVTIDYDIAIVKLAKSLKFSRSVAPISGIADAELQLDVGMKGIISGWGTTSWAGQLADVLQKASVPIVDQEVCNKIYVEFSGVSDRMFCAGLLGEGGRDSCQGDSGGPFIVNNTLVGIVSWGFKCADSKYPGVYSRISAFRPWIDMFL